MLRHFTQLLCAILVATVLAGVTLAPAAQARSPMLIAQNSQITAREAAARAKAQYGGKVLRVRKQGDVYKVRLLQESGRVITVSIRA